MLVCPGKESGGAAVVGETEEDSGAGVDVGVCGGEDDEEEHAVDDVGEDTDVVKLGGDDEGRGCGVGLRAEERWVVVGDQEADAEDGEDEEDENSVESLLDRGWDVLAWVFCLTGCNTDQLGSLVGETSLDENSPEADELAQRTKSKIFGKSTRVLPVSEANTVVVWASSKINADCKDDEADDGNHLDGTEPEFHFTEEFDRCKIQGGHDDPSNGDTNCDVEVGRPVLNNQTGCSEFEGERHTPGEPVDPAHGKAEGRINKASCVGGEGTGNGNVGAHLPERGHDTVDNCANESIGNQSTCWPRLGNRGTRTDEQSRTDCATWNMSDQRLLRGGKEKEERYVPMAII